MKILVPIELSADDVENLSMELEVTDSSFMTEFIENLLKKAAVVCKRTELSATPEGQNKLALYDKYVFPNKKDGFHGSAGAGLRFIMNENFIVAFEYARCFNKQDGDGAFYINIGFLF